MNPHPPILDIVMLVNSQATWADLAIRAVEHHTKNSYRLIIVDQATTNPRMKEMLEGAEKRGHTVIHMPENRSFSNGNNAGVRVGSAKFICILNDDAIVTEGWDGALIQDCSEKGVGMAGARTNYSGGVQSDMSFVGEPPYLVFICVAMRREVWDVVGPMDEERFTGFSSEDLDYSWRVQKAGYKLKLSGAYVLHAGSRSIAANVAADAIARKDAAAVMTALQKHNEKYGAVLQDKWGADFIREHSRIKERVMVATYHAEEWTRVSFMGAFAGLKANSGYTFSYYHQTRAPIHMARQLISDYATDQGYDILIQLDDDATFPPELIRCLLAHQKEVVCALAYQRKPPHLTCAFEIGPDGLLGNPLEDIEHTGLRRVDVSGFHCSLLRTSVIKKLRAAGIKQYYGGFENKVGEDFAFCLNLKKIGVPVHVDTELISGHIGAAITVDEQYKKDWRARNPR